ncbi:MAG: EamA/RhaT family transporter [Limnohabitans sp.]|nr:EamA/RhaT family transporter [Limnohabitans sp.]
MQNNSDTRNAYWQACFCLGLSMALVGCYVALAKPLVSVFGVFALAWLRFVIGALAVPHWLRKPEQEPVLNLRMKGLLFLESFLGNFLFSICMLYGVSQTSAMAAGIILSMLPVVVAMLSVIVLRERLSGRLLLALVFAATGMLLLNTAPRDGAARESQLWGNALVLAAVFCEAAYVVLGKRLSDVMTPRRITAVINLWGCALMTPLALWYWPAVSWSGVAASTWALLLFYGLAASVWSVWLWMTGLQQVKASQAGIFTVMLPVAASITGWVMGEAPDRWQGVAWLMAFLGVALASPRPEREKNNISE